MQISLERVQLVIESVREQYQREEEQAILQRDMEKAVRALSGKDACARLSNSLSLRVQMDESIAIAQRARKRA